MRALAVVVAALAVAGSAAAALPRSGAFVPGSSLGGIRLGESEAQVRAQLGRGYGVCQDCPTTTWYFTYKRFNQQGLGVELTGGRVSAVYTLWKPAGWHAPNALALGVAEGELTASTGALVSIVCPGYDARVTDGHGARSVYYVADGALWGFGLMRIHANPCR